MTRQVFVVAVAALLIAPTGSSAGQDEAGAVSRAIKIMGELQELYPTTEMPRQKLAIASQMIFVIDMLLTKTSPPADTATQLENMKRSWEGLQLSDAKATVTELVSLNQAIGQEHDPVKRTALLRRALEDVDALLANTPPSLTALRDDFNQQRANIAAALDEARKNKRGAENESPSDSVAQVTLARSEPTAVVTRQTALAEPGEHATPANPAVITLEDSVIPARELTPFEKVQSGVSSFVTVLLGAMVTILLAGPIVGSFRWAVGKYVEATRNLWHRYGHKPAPSTEEDADMA